MGHKLVEHTDASRTSYTLMRRPSAARPRMSGYGTGGVTYTAARMSAEGRFSIDGRTSTSRMSVENRHGTLMDEIGRSVNGKQAQDQRDVLMDEIRRSVNGRQHQSQNDM